MKKKILLPLLMLCVGSLAAATATGCKKDPKPTEPTALETLINKESITLELNQEYLLTLDYDGEETPTWTVGDSTIVSVENGKLVALKSGTTTVTVTIGSYTDTISVTVSEIDVEKLSLEVVDSNVSLYKNEEKQITTVVKYDGVAIDSISEKSYESTNADIVSVDADGKMTAKAFGKATITVSYRVNGALLSTSVNVSVVSNSKVEIVQSSVELVYQGEPVTLVAKAYENSAEKTDATITWFATSGQDVIELSGGTITAKNVGETQVTATYVANDGQTQTDTITVKVLPKEVTRETPLALYKNRLEGGGYAVNLETLVNDNENELLSGYVVASDGLKTGLPYEEGKLNLSSLSGGEKSLYLQTKNITYKVDLVLWTALIESVAELQTIQTTTSGWYLLGEDIDLTGTTWEYEESANFSGLFDGNGHSIEGLTTVNSGLFSVLSKNATVKDLTLRAKVTEGGALSTSVAKGSNVTIENITLYADVWEKVNGGLIGMLDGQVTLKNVDGVVSQAMKTETNGALFATASVIPTIENVHIYSSLKICGSSKDNNSKGAEVNEKTGIVTAPMGYATEVTTLQIEETGNSGLSIQFNGNSYVGYTIYANEIRKVSATTGTTVVRDTDVRWRFGGYVDVLFEKADGTIDYYALPISATYYLGNNNIATYLKSDETTTLTGKYLLTEDITLSGTWLNKAIFSGELDGQGHTITGLQVTAGGLFNSIADGATIKNISVVDVYLNASSTGVFAYDTAANSTITFDNVYVSVNYMSVFGRDYLKDERPSAGVLNNHQYKGGLISRAYYDNVNITVNNCVIYMPEFMSGAHGFVAAWGYPKLTIKNSTFIGGNGKVVGTHIGDYSNKPTYTESGDDYVICDAVDAYKALYGSAICDGNNMITRAIPNNATPTNSNGWTDMQITAYEMNHPLKVWGASDVTKANFTALTAITSEIIVLTEDVNFATATWLGNTKNILTGILDGQGHKITNLTNGTSAYTGALFKVIEGSVKNIALEGTLTKYSGSLLADTVQYNTYLENIYVNVTLDASRAGNNGGSNGYSQGGLIRNVANLAVSISMKDIVVYVPGTEMHSESGALIGYGSSKSTSATGLYMENCYYIAPSAQPMGNRGTSTTYYGRKNDADKSFFWDAEYDEEGNLTKADDGLTGYVDTKNETGEIITTGKAAFDTAVNEGKATLTDELEVWIYPTNN